eukprot:4601314-Prymnesium_polylepis.3
MLHSECMRATDGHTRVGATQQSFTVVESLAREADMAPWRSSHAPRLLSALARVRFPLGLGPRPRRTARPYGFISGLRPRVELRGDMIQ